MTIEEILAEIVALLRKEGRISYRLLKRRLALDDDYLEDLKAELIDAKRLAADEDGKVLVWIGESKQASSPQPTAVKIGAWRKSLQCQRKSVQFSCCLRRKSCNQTLRGRC